MNQEKIKEVLQKLIKLGYLDVVDDFVVGTEKTNKLMGFPVIKPIAKSDKTVKPKKDEPKSKQEIMLQQMTSTPMKMIIAEGAKKKKSNSEVDIPHMVQIMDNGIPRNVKVSFYNAAANKLLVTVIKKWIKNLGPEKAIIRFRALIRVTCLFYRFSDTCLTVANYIKEERWEGDIDDMYEVLSCKDPAKQKEKYREFIERYNAQ